MEIHSMLAYLLKSSGVFTIFYGLYYLLFRKNQLFISNRIYLLFLIAFSLLFPLLTFTSFQTVEIPALGAVNNVKIHVESVEIEGAEPLEAFWGKASFTTLILYIYLLISSALFLRLLFQLVQFVVTLSKHSRIEKINGVKVVVSNYWDQTFSFFGIIVLTESDYLRSENNLLIAHELAHVKQFHSLDLLLAELFQVIHWFNPFAYLLKKDMCEVHEYLADLQVVSGGVSKYAYQQLILDCVSNAIAPKVANAFSAKLIKNRFAMMTNNHKPKRLVLRYLTILPIVALLFTTMSFQTKIEYVQAMQQYENILKQEGKSEPIKSKLDEGVVVKDKFHENKKPDTRRARLSKVEKGVFLKEFELDVNNTGRKFSVILKKGCTYRFYLISEDEKEETVLPILLYMHQNDGKLEQINTQWKSYKGYGFFDYIAEKTAVYPFVLPESNQKQLAAFYLLEVSDVEKEEVIFDDKQLAANLDDEVFVVVDEFPKFIHEGYLDARDYFAKNLKYPEEAYKQRIQGRVFVSFVVGRDGIVKNVKIVRGAHELLDAEAIKIVEAMPNWVPGKQKGVPVNVAFTFPLIFNLE